MSEELTEEFDAELAGRRIVIVVTGGIAAYKACELVSRLTGAGAEVRVVMTENARRFVGEATFRALSGHPVCCDMFEEPTSDEIAHVSLAEFAEVIAVVPATANVLGKIAGGICDDFATTVICAARGPVIIAPAMNWAMWQNPIVQGNCQKLSELGYRIVAPEVGRLACGEEGLGRLAGLEMIVAEIVRALGQSGYDSSLAGKHVLITAGPTREHIDPVRFISNPASGRMGFALVRAAIARGAQVTIVSGPTELEAPRQAEMVRIESAADMHQAVMNRLEGVDIFIGAAAVANFTPRCRAEQKIASSEEGLAVELAPTPHILADVAASVQRPQIVVGFAAETENVIGSARDKLADRSLDLVVANDLTVAGAGFGAETNEVTIVRADGTMRQVAKSAKDQVARVIIAEIEQLLELDEQSLKGE